MFGQRKKKKETFIASNFKNIYKSNNAQKKHCVHNENYAYTNASFIESFYAYYNL